MQEADRCIPTTREDFFYMCTILLGPVLFPEFLPEPIETHCFN